MILKKLKGGMAKRPKQYTLIPGRIGQPKSPVNSEKNYDFVNPLLLIEPGCVKTCICENLLDLSGLERPAEVEGTCLQGWSTDFFTGSLQQYQIIPVYRLVRVFISEDLFDL